MSYIPTDEGWLYLAAIKDMAAREILGWSMADHLRAALCVGALVMALQRHGPPPHGLVHHSDCGGQYAADPYRAVLERHGITQSISRRGNCLDNAPIESAFASLKVEHVHQARYTTRDEARQRYSQRRGRAGQGWLTAVAAAEHLAPPQPTGIPHAAVFSARRAYGATPQFGLYSAVNKPCVETVCRR